MNAKKSTHVYEYEIDLESDIAPARVIRMIKSGSRVLEIGAGPGSITRHLSGTLGCDVTALEIDPTAIEKLQSVARSVLTFDLNDSSWAEQVLAQEGTFDYVIAADVLEHVFAPSQVLRGMKSLLNNTGSLVVSLPHVGHAGIAACLIDEDFDYRDWGLLDRTHIRFFGIKNIQALFRSEGLSIEHAEFVIRTPEMTEFAARWKRLPQDIQIALQRNRYSHVYQVVSRIVPSDRARNDLLLAAQPIFPPDASTVALWENFMKSVALPADSDTTSTVEDTGVPIDSTSLVPHGPFDLLDEVGQRVAAKSFPLIAFYLPQFHPIPENDLWWGKGFTEWTNVTKAKPLFEGHNQPHLPADLGFYDLRLRDTRRQQIDLAKSYGISGFCYHYYWFSGKRLLEKPLEDMLADPESDMPFCLCWANENWTRRWDAAEHEVLIEQKYLPEDDENFIKSIIPMLKDARYIRLGTAPLLIIYRPQHLPDAKKSISIWRDYCKSVGIPELHVACALTHGNWDYDKYGCDSGVEFPPNNIEARNFAAHLKLNAPFSGFSPDYAQVAEKYLSRNYGEWKNIFRCVFPSWDNCARKGANGTTVLNGTPENYEFWLARAIAKTACEFPGEVRPVFINAWNEWAEGCHLEPDRAHGLGFLEATLRAKNGSRPSRWASMGLKAYGGNNPDIATSNLLPIDAHHRPKKKKSALSKGFRAVRDTLNGRRFRR